MLPKKGETIWPSISHYTAEIGGGFHIGNIHFCMLITAYGSWKLGLTDQGPSVVCSQHVAEVLVLPQDMQITLQQMYASKGKTPFRERQGTERNGTEPSEKRKAIADARSEFQMLPAFASTLWRYDAMFCRCGQQHTASQTRGLNYYHSGERMHTPYTS